MNQLQICNLIHRILKMYADIDTYAMFTLLGSGVSNPQAKIRDINFPSANAILDLVTNK